jgi:protocatechuate 4,5-dioxygenase alpha chain
VTPGTIGAMAVERAIPGTLVFDGEVARRGYALNAMCFSLNTDVNRSEFLADESAYMQRFELTAAQRDAVARRDVLAMLEAGGNIYYLAKLAGVWGLGVQDVGAQQTGVTVEEFKRRLVEAGR